MTTTRQAAVFLIGLGSTVVLARLLPPETFGTVAIANTYLALMRIFRDGGLSMAAIRSPNLTLQQQSNLFWANLALGLGLAAVVAASAPWLSWLFELPELVPVIIALSLTFLIGSLGVQSRAMLRRQLRFGLLGLIDVASMLAGALVAIVMAWTGSGFWSLVGLQLVTVVIDTVLTGTLSRWRPMRPRRGAGTKQLLHFGAGVTVSSRTRCTR